MHNNRSSSSSSWFLPSLCSLQTFIGLAVILCVYFTLESSISLHDNSLPSQQIKTVSLRSSFLQPKTDEDEEPPTIDKPPPYPYTVKEHVYKNTQEESLSTDPHEQTNTQPITRSEDEGDKVEKLGGLAEYFDISWGDGRGKFHENGSLLTLSLDELCGSGFQSKKEYLFAKIDMHIKLIPNNSAGTVTTFYMSSNETDNHDEIDFEFLGNVSGQPYTIHTNIYSQGKGNREQQFYLWFDPTMDFHSYSILWNSYGIVFFVDGVPIREFPNMEDIGVPFPNKQPMRIFSSLWNADDWATQGGRVHTDWSLAPFVASYRNFSSSSSCVRSSGTSSCGSDHDMSDTNKAWLMEKLDSESIEKMKSVQKKYMTYDYCLDKWRFHEGLPRECNYRMSNR